MIQIYFGYLKSVPQPWMDAAIRRLHQNYEFNNRDGDSFYGTISWPQPWVFLTEDFHVENRSCFSRHFNLILLKSSPCFSLFHQERGEREREKEEGKSHTHRNTERDIFHEKLTWKKIFVIETMAYFVCIVKKYLSVTLGQSMPVWWRGWETSSKLFHNILCLELLLL